VKNTVRAQRIIAIFDMRAPCNGRFLHLKRNFCKTPKRRISLAGQLGVSPEKTVKLRSCAPLVALVIAVDLGEIDIDRAAATLGAKPETLRDILQEVAALRERHAAMKIGKPQREPETAVQIREKIRDRIKNKILAGVTAAQRSDSTDSTS
jgi:hypothetical protein